MPVHKKKGGYKMKNVSGKSKTKTDAMKKKNVAKASKNKKKDK